MHEEYYYIFIFFLISFILACVILCLSYLLASQEGNAEKLTTYECGFDPFGEARSKFDIRFYVVAILFIIFDLEISFLFPWTICLQSIPILGYIVMIIFLFILTVGFVYEWRKGALDWE